LRGLWRRAIVVLLLVGLAAAGWWSVRQQSSFDVVLAPHATVRLYFSDGDAQYLVAEERRVPAGEVTPLRLLEELARGPETPGLLPTIPQGARVLDVTVADGIARVDYSLELRTHHSGGSTGEILTVYSIVATLAQLPDIKAVQLVLEGSDVDTLVGHLDLSRPLLPDARFVSSP